VLQTTFFWTLIARQISQALDSESAGSHHHNRSLVIKPPPELTTAQASVLTPSKHQHVKLTEEQKNMIKEVFHLFDTRTEGVDDNDSGREEEDKDRSGLDESEFSAAIKAMGFSSRHHKKMAKSLMSKVDTDGDNLVSLEEFTSLMEGQLAGRDPNEEMNAIFAAFVDYAENGRITKLRLAEVAEHIGVKLSDDELNSMFDDYAGGGIDQQEFVEILKHSTWI
jgi:Ca2+-binding EF-hand superfamily protein